ncbi:hypothetical protein LINPERPRIM_LOCUS37937 [Linum perenne]
MLGILAGQFHLSVRPPRTSLQRITYGKYRNCPF